MSSINQAFAVRRPDAFACLRLNFRLQLPLLRFIHGVGFGCRSPRGSAGSAERMPCQRFTQRSPHFDLQARTAEPLFAAFSSGQTRLGFLTCASMRSSFSAYASRPTSGPAGSAVLRSKSLNTRESETCYCERGEEIFSARNACARLVSAVFQVWTWSSSST